MFTKFALSILTVLLMVSLAGCATKTPAATVPASDGGNSQNNNSTPTNATEAAENYQMLPMISGKVASMQLDASADGSTQQMKMGEVFAITLETNPSTGYSWVPTISDPKVLAQMGEPQYQEPTQTTAEPLLGAPTNVTMYFQATGTGTTILTLDYKQSFEVNVAPQQTVTIKVEVK